MGARRRVSVRRRSKPATDHLSDEAALLSLAVMGDYGPASMSRLKSGTTSVIGRLSRTVTRASASVPAVMTTGGPSPEVHAEMLVDLLLHGVLDGSTLVENQRETTGS